MRSIVRNFGNNVRFRPRRIYAPTSEQEVLDILAQHRHERIRVMGSRHSWSPVIESDGVLIDTRYLNGVRAWTDESDQVWAEAGAGCTIKRLVNQLRSKKDVTIPSMGLINEQTIAGAISTGTHGSGKSSLSHYVAEVRTAAFDPATGDPKIFTFNSGDELRAARCSLGCLGVILSVKLNCVPRYLVQENSRPAESLDDALRSEQENPLQQFFLMPHSWSLQLQQRRAVEFRQRGQISRLANLYRLYWHLWIDITFHSLVKLFAAVLRSRWLVQFFYRRLMPRLVINRWCVTDFSEKMLVMEHEMFRHLELELFVARPKLDSTLDFLGEMLKWFDAQPNDIQTKWRSRLVELGLWEQAEQLRGSYTHHYPICIRRVEADDTLISMSSPLTGEADGAEDWYAISMITYVEPRDAFFAAVHFLALSTIRLFDARLHWGKHLPVSLNEIELVYPRLARFREICSQVDKHGVFRNEFVNRLLGFER